MPVEPWNKGRDVGQKRALTVADITAIRAQLQNRPRDLALFALALDSRLRARELVALKVGDVETRFALSDETRTALAAWAARRGPGDFLFPSRARRQPHLSTRQYARLVRDWMEAVGLDSALYGTHSMRRAEAAEIYRSTGDLKAAQRLLGHARLESTARYLGRTL